MNQRKQPTSIPLPSDLAVFRLQADSTHRPTRLNFAPESSYGALAAKLGTRDARDVTEAIGSNTIAILIPCHRVIKKDGSISGYRVSAGSEAYSDGSSMPASRGGIC